VLQFKLQQMPKRTAAVWMAAAMLVLSTQATWASEDAERARILTEGGEILPLEQLIAQAREHKPGTLIEAELDWEPDHGVAVYELLMLGEDGELWELELDARTGRLLEVEREHD
jgi:uncharacterized membrane protein YkoI